eukprot:TRINITY_DN10630_c0_g3_i1.p2 TRINITY_DN10630_c0_g3~~TRINITY_DN10630_c0_g3_i1.p2  ORF type:complete len:129 (+),score=15.99 TRINITY_DN10630_c0_g3_i1:43-429(+)
MGSGSTKPRETDLHGSRFLALCAAEADGDTTTHVRVRLLIRGERRTLQVYSPDGVVCTTIDQQGVDHDIGNVQLQFLYFIDRFTLREYKTKQKTWVKVTHGTQWTTGSVRLQDHFQTQWISWAVLDLS